MVAGRMINLNSRLEIFKLKTERNVFPSQKRVKNNSFEVFIFHRITSRKNFTGLEFAPLSKLNATLSRSIISRASVERVFSRGRRLKILPSVMVRRRIELRRPRKISCRVQRHNFNPRRPFVPFCSIEPAPRSKKNLHFHAPSPSSSPRF